MRKMKVREGDAIVSCLMAKALLSTALWWHLPNPCLTQGLAEASSEGVYFAFRRTEPGSSWSWIFKEEWDVYLLLKCSWGGERERENNSFAQCANKGNGSPWNSGNIGEGSCFSGQERLKRNRECEEWILLKQQVWRREEKAIYTEEEAWRPGCEGTWMFAEQLMGKSWNTHFKKTVSSLVA